MMNKFSTIIDFRKCFDSVDICNNNEVIVKLVQHLLDNNHGSTIISGLFRQLYWEGENNTSEFLNDLLNYSKQITRTHTDTQKDKVNGTFDLLPDSLLCHIGSFLTTRGILCKWDLINRRFLQMGLKAEIFTQWNVDENCPKILSKFDISPLLQQVALFKLHHRSYDLAAKIGIGGLKSLKTVQFQPEGRLSLLQQYLPLSCDTLHLSFADIDCHCEGFERLKRIDLINCAVSDWDMTREDIDNFLQLIVPLSPKEIELRKRLKKEITNEMRESKQLWEIEKLENDIKDEIDEKYDPKFDENELNTINDENKSMQSMQKRKYEWNCQLEMLSLVDFDNGSDEPDDHGDELLQHCISQLVPNRIEQALVNLRGLCLRGDIDWNCPTIGPLAAALLNTLTNQLVSLHIDDHLLASLCNDWSFVKNNYPCTKASIGESWHPSNVEEMCFIYAGYPLSRKFLLKINSSMFPKLKHLKVEQTVEEELFCINSEKNIWINNLSSLIINGLESLQIRFTKLDFRDFATNFNVGTYENRQNRILINDILQYIREIFAKSKNDSLNRLKQNRMIVKLEFDIRLPSIGSMDSDNMVLDVKNTLQSIGTKLLLIYSWLAKQYDRVMLGFKLRILGYGSCPWVWLFDIRNDIKKLVKEHIVFQNEDCKVVDISITEQAEFLNGNPKELVFAAMFKSLNKGETNMSCQFCHMEPKFKYHCNRCQATPWGVV